MGTEADKLAFYLLKRLNKAVYEFDMLADGDRIGVAVSGGPDSLTLLRLLQIRQRSAPERYELVALHVIGDARGPEECQEHPPLREWLEASGMEFAIEPMRLSPEEPLPMDCQRCTWNRRKTLFRMAHRLGCNKLAFGHHANDVIETTLLNLFYTGRLETLVPKASYFGGTFVLIRPLVYIFKKELLAFARASDFPPPPPPCPRSELSRRRLMARLVRQVEEDYPDAGRSILRASARLWGLKEGE